MKYQCIEVVSRAAAYRQAVHCTIPRRSFHREITMWKMPKNCAVHNPYKQTWQLWKEEHQPARELVRESENTLES